MDPVARLKNLASTTFGNGALRPLVFLGEMQIRSRFQACSILPLSDRRLTPSAVLGCAALLVDTIQTFGTLKIADVLEPAIRLAEEGFAPSNSLHIHVRLTPYLLQCPSLGAEQLSCGCSYHSIQEED